MASRCMHAQYFVHVCLIYPTCEVQTDLYETNAFFMMCTFFVFGTPRQAISDLPSCEIQTALIAAAQLQEPSASTGHVMASDVGKEEQEYKFFCAAVSTCAYGCACMRVDNM